MRSCLIRALVTLTAGSTVAATYAPDPGSAGGSPVFAVVLERFLADNRSDGPVPYRALRRLDARAERFVSAAAMEVWTEVDEQGGMRYRIVSETGSDYIRSKVFRGVLEAEQEALKSGAADKAGITPENYAFDQRGSAGGLVTVGLKPRRKDMLLVDGWLLVRPDDGALFRLEGRLTRTPSFLVRRVQIVRNYRRLAGVSMPVALDSVARLLFAGRSTFHMTYDYETVNGHRVGNPAPGTLASAEQ